MNVLADSVILYGAMKRALSDSSNPTLHARLWFEDLSAPRIGDSGLTQWKRFDMRTRAMFLDNKPQRRFRFRIAIVTTQEPLRKDAVCVEGSAREGYAEQELSKSELRVSGRTAITDEARRKRAYSTYGISAPCRVQIARGHAHLYIVRAELEPPVWLDGVTFTWHETPNSPPKRLGSFQITRDAKDDDDAKDVREPKRSETSREVEGGERVERSSEASSSSIVFSFPMKTTLLSSDGPRELSLSSTVPIPAHIERYSNGGEEEDAVDAIECGVEEEGEEEEEEKEPEVRILEENSTPPTSFFHTLAGATRETSASRHPRRKRSKADMPAPYPPKFFAHIQRSFTPASVRANGLAGSLTNLSMHYGALKMQLLRALQNYSQKCMTRLDHEMRQSVEYVTALATAPTAAPAEIPDPPQRLL